MEYFASAFPFLTPFEPRVPAHEFGKERMELVFCSEVEFECIHKRDE
jgi:hypothetical protein